MKATIKVGIIGGAGYTGGELIRLLLHHPRVEISFVHSKSNAGNPVHQVHEDLLGSTTLQFTDSIDQNIDVLFLCLGHGESSKFLQENTISEQINIIDLANDFRLESNANFQNRKFVYGLPELNFQQIASAKNIANPGCFATAIQLGLLPLASKGLVNDVYTTAITGSTGAGQSLSATSHFSSLQNADTSTSWRNSSVAASTEFSKSLCSLCSMERRFHQRNFCFFHTQFHTFH